MIPGQSVWETSRTLSSFELTSGFRGCQAQRHISRLVEVASTVRTLSKGFSTWSTETGWCTLVEVACAHRKVYRGLGLPSRTKGIRLGWWNLLQFKIDHIMIVLHSPVENEIPSMVCTFGGSASTVPLAPSTACWTSFGASGDGSPEATRSLPHGSL